MDLRIKTLEETPEASFVILVFWFATVFLSYIKSFDLIQLQVIYQTKCTGFHYVKKLNANISQFGTWSMCYILWPNNSSTLQINKKIKFLDNISVIRLPPRSQDSLI